MNIKDYAQKFQAIEIENGLFQQHDDRGVLFWDVVRYHVYQALYFALDKVEIGGGPKRSRYVALRSFIGNIWNVTAQFFSAMPSKRKPYMVFNFSRYKTPAGLNIDYVSNDVVKALGDEVVMFENYCSDPVQFHYRSKMNSFPTIISYLRNIRRKLTGGGADAVYFATEKLFNDAFGVNCSLAQFMADFADSYRQEYPYYLNLFRRYRPKAIFLTMTGGEKALCAAASALGISVVEIQHCLINFYQPYYSYPHVSETSHLPTNPEYILTFADFWTRQNSSPVKKFAVGNNYYLGKQYADPVKYGLLIITANIYRRDLEKMLDDVLAKGFEKPIALKLHPNQLDVLEETKAKYAAYPNVDVILAEKSLDYLIHISEVILSIQSTGIYQALNQNKKVIILREKNYQVHEDVFDVSNVHLVDSAEQFFEAEQSPMQPAAHSRYFDAFDEQKFRYFLDQKLNDRSQSHHN